MTALRCGAYLAYSQRAGLSLDSSSRTRTICTSEGDPVVYTWHAGATWVPTPGEVGTYTGRYRSDEIGTPFTVAVD